jgi:hypothetical protein
MKTLPGRDHDDPVVPGPTRGCQEKQVKRNRKGRRNGGNGHEAGQPASPAPRQNQTGARFIFRFRYHLNSQKFKKNKQGGRISFPLRNLRRVHAELKFKVILSAPPGSVKPFPDLASIHFPANECKMHAKKYPALKRAFP